MKPHGQDDLDALVRNLHARAVEQVRPRTLYELRVRRANAARAATRASRRLPGWSLAAAAGAAVLALVVGLRPDIGRQAAPEHAMPVAAVEAVATDPDDGDALVAFEEDPELFLWLASVDAQPLAME